MIADRTLETVQIVAAQTETVQIVAAQTETVQIVAAQTEVKQAHYAINIVSPQYVREI